MACYIIMALFDHTLKWSMDKNVLGALARLFLPLKKYPVLYHYGVIHSNFWSRWWNPIKHKAIAFILFVVKSRNNWLFIQTFEPVRSWRNTIKRPVHFVCRFKRNFDSVKFYARKDKMTLKIVIFFNSKFHSSCSISMKLK